ncbi:hypothetical protein ACJMK2_037184 [Sinanodonta woodiana]|uniref:Uncharacterized protein n=1 Tax=Sinanodonta woodiana TaxID=1069815 RepID=A0ABD3WJI3_SINWO
MSCVRSDVMRIDKTWPISGGKRSECHCYQEIVQVETTFTINVTFNTDTYNPELWIGSIMSQDINGRWYCVRNLYIEHPPFPIILLVHVSHAGTTPLSGQCIWNLVSNNVCFSGISETTSLISPTQSSFDHETKSTIDVPRSLLEISSSLTSPIPTMISSSSYVISSEDAIIVTSPAKIVSQEISFATTQSQYYTLTFYDTSSYLLEASLSSHYSLVTFDKTTISSRYVLESASSNTTGRECQCHWQCLTSSDSQEEASKLLEKIISDMVIPRNSTASARRRRTCAPDERVSSKGIGYIGVLVMTVVFGTIVVADLKKIFDNLTFAYENFRRLAVIGYSVKKFKSMKSSRKHR